MSLSKTRWRDIEEMVVTSDSYENYESVSCTFSLVGLHFNIFSYHDECNLATDKH